LRAAGVAEVSQWLRRHGGYKAAKLADKVLQAALSQEMSLPAEGLAAHLIAQTAEEVLFLEEQLKDDR
jgi:hypothetical protein